jgi:hypothetical protein
MFQHFAWNGYDLEWKVPTSSKSHVGDLVGSLRSDGYVQVQFYGKMYRLHNLIWLWHKGEWPNGEVDHIDRDPENNHIDNLRLTSSTGQKLNASGHFDAQYPRGIAFDTRYPTKPYRVQISRHYKVVHRSHHELLEDAIKMASQVYAELEEIEFG